MISLPQALATYAQFTPLPVEQVPLGQALNRVLRAEVYSQSDLPRFDNSALDGYVIHAQNCHQDAVTLPIVGSTAAGAPIGIPLQADTTQRILTGAPVPAGASSVVAQERVLVRDNTITLQQAIAPHKNIRYQGEEVKQGAVLAQAGQVLTAGMLGALAAAGVSRVQVARALRVAVLVTGDEVKPIGTPLTATQVWDANSVQIAAWCAGQGIAATTQWVGDTAVDVQAALQQALDHHDVVITTGGVSVGDKDFIRPAASALGLYTHFWGVAQKPGKPMLLAQSREGSVLVGLPGNPAAVTVALAVHVKPLLAALTGAKPPMWHWGVLTKAVKRDGQRTRLVRAVHCVNTQGVNQLTVLPLQDSHMLSNLSAANSVVDIPAGEGECAAGERVRFVDL